MGTPHADRLYKMESWRTSALEDSHRHLASVSQSLTQIATGNREVAADLGLECATARAACASLDRLAGRMLTQADALKQIVKSSTDVLNAGIDARNESVEIQAKLSKLNKTIDRAEKFANAMPAPEAAVATERLRAQRQAAHAKIDSLAKTSLSKLNERTLAAIDGLPLHDQASVDHVGRSSAGGQAGRNLAAGSKAGLPTRSAAAWGASVDTSLGGPGRHAGHHDSLGVGASGGSGSASGPGGGGASLQASHYAPPSSGAIASSGSSGSPTGVVGHSPAVHNPLASAVAITGGAGVAGYKAYQAARAARAVQTPAACLCRPGGGSRPFGLFVPVDTGDHSRRNHGCAHPNGVGGSPGRCGAGRCHRDRPPRLDSLWPFRRDRSWSDHSCAHPGSLRPLGQYCSRCDHRRTNPDDLACLGRAVRRASPRPGLRGRTHPDDLRSFGRAVRWANPGPGLGGPCADRRAYPNRQRDWLLPKSRLVSRGRRLARCGLFFAWGTGRPQRLIGRTHANWANRPWRRNTNRCPLQRAKLVRQVVPVRPPPDRGRQCPAFRPPPGSQRIVLAGPVEPDRQTRQKERTPPGR